MVLLVLSLGTFIRFASRPEICVKYGLSLYRNSADFYGI